MKFLQAGDALGAAPAPKQAIEVGGIYGHLEVIREAPRATGSNDRRWLCRCLNVTDGKMCGAETIKRTGQLTKPGAFRACKGCTEEYARVARHRWNSGASY